MLLPLYYKSRRWTRPPEILLAHHLINTPFLNLEMESQAARPQPPIWTHRQVQFSDPVDHAYTKTPLCFFPIVQLASNYWDAPLIKPNEQLSHQNIPPHLVFSLIQAHPTMPRYRPKPSITTTLPLKAPIIQPSCFQLLSATSAYDFCY